MVINPNGRYPYKELNTTRGLNGIIKAFNGEYANGSLKSGDPTCVGGIIRLKPSPSSPDPTAMVNKSGCNGSGSGPYVYSSYDEHPGYDYRANYGTPVKAAASGYVVNGSAGRCVPNGVSCNSFGYVGIDHLNGYISQYGHLSTIYVSAGQWVNQRQQIGLSGCTGLSPCAPHLHFEVLKLIPGRTNNYAIDNYAVVDPYGWVGVGSDPLYSRSVWGIAPANLWQ